MSDTLFIMTLSLLPVLPVLILYSVINTRTAALLFTSLVTAISLSVIYDSAIVFCFTLPLIFLIGFAVFKCTVIKRKFKKYIVVENKGKDGLYIVSDGAKEHTLALLDECEKGSIIYVRNVGFD